MLEAKHICHGCLCGEMFKLGMPFAIIRLSGFGMKVIILNIAEGKSGNKF